MPLTVNIRHLQRDDALEFRGQLTLEELQLGAIDEVIHASLPLTYDLRVELLQDSILVQGKIEMMFDCECVRCLRPFKHRLRLDHWVCHLLLHGEDAVPVVNDLVDLTPHLREDIFLALPQHPVCNPDCHDLPGAKTSRAKQPDRVNPLGDGSSAWAALDKLKLD